MKRLAFLIAACWAGLPACTQAQTDGTGVEVDPAFAAAVAARRRPELVLPERPVTPIGRCAIEIGPRPPETRLSVERAFRDRNGYSWVLGGSSVDDAQMTLTSAYDPTAVDLGGPIVARTDDEAVKIAIDFVATNYELFGLSRADLAHVTIRPGSTRDDGTAISRTVELRGDNPLRGHEEIPSLTQSWRWYVDFSRQGRIYAVIVNSHDLLPAIELCTDPRIPEGDTLLTKDVIGYHLVYYSVAGQPIDVGLVNAGDVHDATLVVHRTSNSEQHSVSLRLAYSIDVSRAGLPWDFIVDADTGELIYVDQLFRT